MSARPTERIVIPPMTRLKTPLAVPGVLQCSWKYCNQKAVWRIYRVGGTQYHTRYACPQHAAHIPDELVARATIMRERGEL